MGGGSYTYPREQVEAIWQDVLLFQFHDVLPGSAIGMVYDVALARYGVIVPQLIALREAALAAAVAGRQYSTPSLEPSEEAPAGRQYTFPTPAPSSAEAPALLLSCNDILGALSLPSPLGGGDGSDFLSAAPIAPQPPPCMFNSLGFARTEVVAVPSGRVPPWVPVHQWTTGGAEALLEVTTPPLSLNPLFSPQGQAAGWAGHQGQHNHPGASAETMTYSSFLAATSGATGGRGSIAVSGDEMVYVLSNRFLRVAFDCRYRISSGRGSTGGNRGRGNSGGNSGRPLHLIT